jgi:protocatechuate 3,4-dioxygenase beta subunit
VTVEQRPIGAGASAFSVVGTAVTEADGSYKLTPAAFDTNTMFRVREGAHGARTVVRVAPVITLSGPTSGVQASDQGSRARRASRRPKATFTGKVSPTGMGTRVALQISYTAAGERWHTVAFGSIGADGSYSITHGFRISGEMRIRAVAHTGTRNVAAISEALSYVASQPQNPRLTINTSANPISYGQSVTISGVAAGAANQPVTLLARTAGSSFAVVAKATTDEAGNYTFTQAPPEITSYRVTDAATSSTVVYEPVKSVLVADAAPAAALSGQSVQSVQSGQQLTFSGTLTPAHAGQLVYLEREYASGVGYHVVEVGTVNAASGYTIVHTFYGVGTDVLRIRVPSDSEHQASTSEPFTVTVTH